MKSMPLIQKFMTAMPHTVGAEIPLSKAKALMSEFRIRHLPVLQAGTLVGILTDRDINLASSFEGCENFVVEDVMTPNTYCVKPTAPVDAVALEMAEKKYGSAIVQQENGKVVGIFTAVDGLRVLGELLAEHYHAGA